LILFVIWLSLWALPVRAASPVALEPRIAVQRPAALARFAWPVTAGVPFPRGARTKVTDLRIDAEGPSGNISIPTQARILSRWPDGSVRWALIDWQVDPGIDPGATTHRYRIRKGEPKPPRQPLTLRENSDGITIDSGKLRLIIPKTRFAVIDAVQVDGKPAGAGAMTSFIDVDGNRHEAQAPSRVSVLEAGPLRARVELRGTYGADFHYIIRVDAYAGDSLVRVHHSFEQRGPAAFTRVRQIGIDVPLPGFEKATYRAGRERQVPLSGVLSQVATAILQEDPSTLRLNGFVQPGRMAGWVDVHDTTRGLVIAGRFPWQEYPQSFQLAAGRLTYNLLAAEGSGVAVGMGAAKTHEFVIDFHGKTPPSPEQLEQLAHPLLAHVDPGWVAASGALPNGIAPTATTTPFLDELRAGFQRFQERQSNEVWDDSGTVHCSPPDQERRRQGLYGMLNWGDWNYPGFHDVINGCDTWGNLDYDTTQVLALAYAAIGDPDLHTAMTAAARHFMDVDVIHHAPPACDCVGMNHMRKALHFSFEPSTVDLGFTWTEGLVSYYWLTGDERALAAARGIADYLARHIPDPSKEIKPRQWGWPPIALLAVYDATGIETYKTAASEYARRGMAAYPPTSGRDVGVGTLADALAYVHAHTQDHQVQEWLLSHTAGVIASPPGAEPRYFPAVAYVGRITKNRDYQRAAAEAVPRQQFGDWGTPFTLAGRLGFRIHSLQP